MKFEWDENKRKLNLVKHGIDFKDAQQIFDGITFTFKDERYKYGEDRYITIGLLLVPRLKSYTSSIGNK